MLQEEGTAPISHGIYELLSVSNKQKIRIELIKMINFFSFWKEKCLWKCPPTIMSPLIRNKHE